MCLICLSSLWVGLNSGPWQSISRDYQRLITFGALCTGLGRTKAGTIAGTTVGSGEKCLQSQDDREMSMDQPGLRQAERERKTGAKHLTEGAF